MEKIFQEFKTFAMRGNVIDMAVGVIIGGAFGKIVSSLVADIIMPTIGLLIGGINFTNLNFVLKDAILEGDTVVSPAVTINYGTFIQTSIDFVIIAFAIFLFIKIINSVKKKEKTPDPTPAPTPEDILLLQEIRDLLKDKK
jgi:large conductance mechanosensitive channel protein